MQKGQKHTDEAKAKIGAAAIQRTHTPEVRQRMSEIAYARAPWSEEVRKKMSESAKKRAPHSEETRRKISETRLARERAKKEST